MLQVVRPITKFKRLQLVECGSKMQNIMIFAGELNGSCLSVFYSG